MKAYQPFPKFVEYLTKVHGSQLGSYQLLARAWNLELGDGECYADHVTKLELLLRDAAEQIKQRFSKEKSCKQKNRIISRRCVPAEKVKERSPKIFGLVIKTMYRHWTANNIAHEAKRYQERLEEESEEILSPDGNVFFARKQRTR